MNNNNNIIRTLQILTYPLHLHIYAPPLSLALHHFSRSFPHIHIHLHHNCSPPTARTPSLSLNVCITPSASFRIAFP
jgi:hypothetical protein